MLPVVVEGAPNHEAGAATLSPRSDDDVAVGVPATGRMKIVLSGDRRVIVDRAVDGGSAGACDFGAGAAMVPMPLIPMS